MPFPIKFGLSVIVILVAIAAYFFQDSLGQVGPKYATAFLGVFMVVAMWVFPEVTRKSDDRG
jgi:hypothetical protein